MTTILKVMLLLIKNHFVIKILRQPQKKGYPTISNLSAEKNVFQVLQTT